MENPTGLATSLRGLIDLGGLPLVPGGVFMGLLDLKGAFGKRAHLAYLPWARAGPLPLSLSQQVSLLFKCF